MSNLIFAIDQSISCTGWVILLGKELVDFGCIKTSKTDGELYDRVDIITTLLDDIAGFPPAYGFGNISIHCREGLGFGSSNSNASRDLAYLVGAIENKFGTPFKEVPPTSLKKFATGVGKGKDKQPMIDALPVEVRQRFLDAGYKKTTGLADLADAYWIGRYFLEQEEK